MVVQDQPVETCEACGDKTTYTCPQCENFLCSLCEILQGLCDPCLDDDEEEGD